MKKTIICISIAVLILTSALLTYAYEKSEKISSSVIRLHIIANSDSEYDQQIKLKVRDHIINAMEDKFKSAKNLEDARQIIIDNIDYITTEANYVLADNDCLYSADSALMVCNFPAKSYANITLPKGDYEALRVVLGSGNGQNWWCVMFPPLCFTEDSMGKLNNKSEQMLKTTLGDSTYDIIDNNNTELKIKYKFKLIEVYEDIKSWF